MKITIVTNIPTPYQNSFFGQLAARPDVDLHVVYAGMTEPNRDWVWSADDFDYSYEMPWRVPLSGRMGIKHTNPGILLSRPVWTADAVIIGGWSFPTVLAAALMRVATRRAWFYWIENFAYDPAASFRSHRAKRWLLNQASGVLPIDSRCEANVLSAGVRPEAIERFPYVTDSAEIASQTAALRARDPSGDSNVLNVLFVGQLTERKGLAFAIDALGQVASEGHAVVLTVIGSGPQEQSLRERAARHPELSVRFEGFAQPDQLPHYYAAADVALVPSLYDGWALVVNEGLAAGLPVVATTAVGASDVIEDGVSGYVVEPGDVDALSVVLRRFAEDRAHLNQMKRDAANLGASLDASHQAEKLLGFVRRRLNAPHAG